MITQNKRQLANALQLKGWRRATPGPDLKMTVRPASPPDIPAVAELLGRLSGRTRHLRYFTVRPFIPQEALSEAERIVQRQGAQGFALLGTMMEGDAEAVVAVAELARAPASPRAGELAVVVRDDYQARGVGHLLVGRLLELARLHGVTTLRATMLPENQAMRRLLRGLGVPHRIWYEAGDVEVELSLNLIVGQPLPQGA